MTLILIPRLFGLIKYKRPGKIIRERKNEQGNLAKGKYVDLVRIQR